MGQSDEPQTVPGVKASLRVLATTDLHAHLHPFNYYTGNPDHTAGLAQLAPLIHMARAEVTNSLLVDCGDALQGTPLADWVARSWAKDGAGQALHPMIAAMNALGYDAACMGNHDFNYGLDHLGQTLRGAKFPLLAANLRWAKDGTPAFDQRHVLEVQITDADGARHPLHLGVLGLVPPQTVMWDAANLNGALLADDILDTGAAQAAALRREGAELILALCHSGLGPVEPVTGMENAARALAALPGIDAVVCGHSHGAFPGPDAPDGTDIDSEQGCIVGTPVVMPGAFARYLGVIDLELQRDPGGWRMGTGRSTLRPIDPQQVPDPKVIIAAAQAHSQTKAYMQRPVGESHVPLHSYFALAAPCPALSVVAQAQADFARKALAGGPYAGLPLISAVAPFRTGGGGDAGNFTDVPAGSLTQSHVADLYYYPNVLQVLEMTGAAVHAFLEQVTALYSQLVPDQPLQPLQRPGWPGYNFETLYGLRYTIDLGAAPGSGKRICGLTFEGAPLGPEARVLVATNNYRGGALMADRTAQAVLETHQSVRGLLADYIAADGPRTAGPMPHPWALRGPKGASAVLRTGAGAAAHSEEAAALGLTFAPDRDPNFLRLVLTF